MKHFIEQEFDCKCGCGLGFKEMNQELRVLLDIAREEAGVQFVLNSAVRCPKHNKSVGGLPNSSHLTGNAVDIACKNSYDRFMIITGLMAAGIDRIGIGADFIHTDNDYNKPKESMWVYNK